MGRKKGQKKIRGGILIPLLLSLSGILHSQNLQWEEIVVISEKNNPEILAARSSVESSQARVKASYGDFMPQLSGNGSYSKSGTASSETNEEYSMSLNVQQSLFSGFKSKANLDSAKSQLRSAEENLAVLESQVFRDLRSAYINVLYAQENIKLLEKIRDRKIGNKKLIELRYEGGRENRGAFLRAQAQLSQAQFELDQATRARRVFQASLSRALGRDLGESFNIIGSFEVKVKITTQDFSSLSIRTPLYRKSQASLAAVRAGLNQAKSDFFPSLSLSGSGSRRGSKFPLDKDSWSIGAAISYLFFSGGRNYYGVRDAQAEIRSASSQLENQRREIEISLEDAFAKLQDANSQVEIQKQFLEAAEERAKIARAQYNNGLVSYQDWDIIENDLTNTEKQTLESLRRVGLAETTWIQAQGLHALP